MFRLRKLGKVKYDSRDFFFSFFFSSRRRHTRFDCDWSSDVCSSDLRRGCARATGRRRRRGSCPRLPPPESRLEQRGIDVTATHHEHRGGARLQRAGAQRRRRGRAGGLDREAALPPEKMYRLAKALVIYERDARDPRAMLDEVRERDVTHRERDQPVRDALGALEPRRPARGERALQLWRTLGLDAP